MHNLSDEDMDRLSREASEQYRTPVPPGNWDKLSAMLDKEMPVADPLWKKWIWPLSDLLLLLLAFTIYTGYNQEPGKTIANKSERITENLTEEPAANTVSPENSGKDIENKQKTDSRPLTVQGNFTVRDPGNTPEPVADSRGITNPKKSTEISSGRTLSNTKPATQELNTSEKNKPFSEDPIEDNNQKSLAGSLVNNINDQAKNEKARQVTPDKQPGLNDSQVSIPALNKMPEVDVSSDSITVKRKPTDSTAIAAEDAEMDKTDKSEVAKKLFTGKKGKWEAGILYSPDFSRVGNARAVKNGHNFGISLGYHLDERWSVLTGAIYSRKNYTALQTGYQKVPGYNSYDPNIKVNKVQAECYMWEIPLNIRYNFLVTRSQKAFITAGISSYFMEKEDLHYWYTYNNNPRYKAWINEQNSSYWFSVAGISAGFEQYITPSISIQAEPFFRFTLKEVGYGYINLKTMGIFLGVKYSPPPRSSKK